MGTFKFTVGAGKPLSAPGEAAQAEAAPQAGEDSQHHLLLEYFKHFVTIMIDVSVLTASVGSSPLTLSILRRGRIH